MTNHGDSPTLMKKEVVLNKPFFRVVDNNNTKILATVTAS